jgi:hypothetical protein
LRLSTGDSFEFVTLAFLGIEVSHAPPVRRPKGQCSRFRFAVRRSAKATLPPLGTKSRPWKQAAGVDSQSLAIITAMDPEGRPKG